MRTVRSSPGRFIQGAAETVLPGLPWASFDAIVTDPPYGLGFMCKQWDSPGKSFVERKADKQNTWDHVGGNHNPVNTADAVRTKRVENHKYQLWCELWAAECLRLLKPGGYIVAFGGTRTYHRLTCALEDAGFEIRDSLHWIYGSGFPKSLDVSKAIDKAAGARSCMAGDFAGGKYMETAPATENAAGWSGWGTALKPAHEPIILARKPLSESTVAGNVLRWQTGALNIDACRVQHATALDLAESQGKNQHTTYSNQAARMGANGIYGDAGVQRPDYDGTAGRWPPNLLLSHSAGCNGECTADCPVAAMDAQSGLSRSPSGVITGGRNKCGIVGTVIPGARRESVSGHGDTGGASRFFPQFEWSPEYDLPFMYCAKAPKKERPQAEGISGHPTVKPVALMRWLVRLVTPPGGSILDPFAGTGTTVQAALDQGFRCTGVDSWPDAVELAKIRLAGYPCIFR